MNSPVAEANAAIIDELKKFMETAVKANASYLNIF